MDDSTKKSDGSGNTSSVTAQTTESQESDWNEKAFWDQHDAMMKRVNEATFRTGEPTPVMILEENARFSGIAFESAVTPVGKCRHVPKHPAIIARRALYRDTLELVESYQSEVGTDGIISVLRGLVAHFETCRHGRDRSE